MVRNDGSLEANKEIPCVGLPVISLFVFPGIKSDIAGFANAWKKIRCAHTMSHYRLHDVGRQI